MIFLFISTILILILFLFLLYQRNIEHYYTYANDCSKLSNEECLKTPNCGILHDRYPMPPRCLPGTAEGTLDPRLMPDAEEGYYKNLQLDFWQYSSPTFPSPCMYKNKIHK